MNKILETTKFVVENSSFVKINRERIAEFSKNFDHEKTKHWLSAAPFSFDHFSDEEKLHFLIIFNALSFSYWGEPKWSVEYNGKKHDGSWGMILALGRTIEENIPILDFRHCSLVSEEDFAQILRGNTEIPLLAERWKILREIGAKMVAKYDGKASNLIAEASGDAQKLIELIVQNFPSFADTSPYKGKEIYFYKRAQLLVADIHQIFNGRGVGALKNVDHVTACADYKLPQILRKFGILEYRTVRLHKQMIKSWRAKKTSDLSLSMYILMTAGNALWLIYGIFISSFSLFVANVITSGLNLSILVLKIRYK